MADPFPPSGLDRADGLNGNTGAATPDEAYSQSPEGAIFQEDPTSPECERAEQGTFTHKFNTDWESGRDLLRAYGRGVIVADSGGDIFRVLSSRLSHSRGKQATFSLTTESLSFDAPPDEFDVEDIELNPALFLHPLFAPVLAYNYHPNSQLNKINTAAFGGQEIISAIQNAINLPQSLASAEQQAGLNITNIPNNASLSPLYPDANILTLANLLLQKMQQGVDTFYLAGFRIVWSQFFYLPPLINPGGYIEDPFGGTDSLPDGTPIPDGGLPNYFWSDTGDVGGHNIFTYLAKSIEPQIYGKGISWLRLCDKVTFQRTWFKMTRSWMGAPLGHWDYDLYCPQYVQIPPIITP